MQFEVMLPVEVTGMGTMLVPHQLKVENFIVLINDPIYGWVPMFQYCTREERRIIIKAFMKRSMELPKAGGER